MFKFIFRVIKNKIDKKKDDKKEIFEKAINEILQEYKNANKTLNYTKTNEMINKSIIQLSYLFTYKGLKEIIKEKIKKQKQIDKIMDATIIYFCLPISAKILSYGIEEANITEIIKELEKISPIFQIILELSTMIFIILIYLLFITTYANILKSSKTDFYEYLLEKIDKKQNF